MRTAAQNGFAAVLPRSVDAKSFLYAVALNADSSAPRPRGRNGGDGPLN